MKYMKQKLILRLRYWLDKILKHFRTDVITFKISTEIDDKEIPWDYTDIIINQKSLFERLKEYELSEARRTKTNVELAGKYIGVDPYFLYQNT